MTGTMLMTRLTLAGALLAATASFGCGSDEGKSCTLIGCAGGFSIDFAKTSAWQAGEYVVSVKLDGSETVCTVTLPFASCTTGASCSGDTKSVQLGQSGCALESSQHKLSGLQILDKAPAQVVVAVKFAGAELGAATYAPKFTESRPNGAGCEPVCNQAPTEKLALK